MEIIKNDKYNYFYDGKIKLMGYRRFRIMRLINSRSFYRDDNLLARFPSIILVCLLDEILWEFISLFSYYEFRIFFRQDFMRIIISEKF